MMSLSHATQHIKLTLQGSKSNVESNLGRKFNLNFKLFNSKRRTYSHQPTKKLFSIAKLNNASSSLERNDQVDDCKLRLLEVIHGVERGARTTSEQRAIIEEAQIELEKYGGEVVGQQLNHLDGLWKLAYTTAPDVISLLQVQHFPIPLLQIGDIFQRFECSENSSEGVVENIVKWSIAGILQENNGAQLTVKAKFVVRSNRSIQLRFEEASINNVQISSSLETILAPAILPRTQITMEVLQFLRGLELNLPLSGPSSLRSSTVGLSPYLLTYLDEDLLVGRAINPPGNFIFQREN